jgi:malate synthase A
METAMYTNPIPRPMEGLEVVGSMPRRYEEILTEEALSFVADLARKFTPRRDALLERRIKRQREIDGGKMPDFLPETAPIRNSEWKIGPIPPDLQDRRAEITGPVDRKMIINALNSGAKAFMADLEDSLAPAWNEIIEGQINLRDAVDRTIELTTPEGKHYKLKDNLATLIVRPRGWHLPEKHVLLDGKPIPGAFLDFGLFFFHNAHKLLDRGSAPYFYFPKLQNHLEARLWNEILNAAEDALNIPCGTTKVTVLIENILAAFEMDEILYELRDHIVGLNCGRWDYIFSFIDKFHKHPDFVLPDRAQVTMTTHFLRSYSLLLIKTCHRRGAFAMGGMAAQVPIKDNPQANEIALAKVRADKEREASDGHDGAWVAHPGLVPVTMEVFDKYMPGPNQLNKLRADVHVSAADLLQVPEGKITEAGLRNNVNVAIHYLAAWLGGIGCVPLHHLMEDAATAEIARAQIWQWIRHPRGVLDDGRKVSLALFRDIRKEETTKIREEVGETRYIAGRYPLAADLLDKISADEKFVDFLTLIAYEHLQ